MFPSALLVLGLLLTAEPAPESSPATPPGDHAAPAAIYSLYLPSTFTPDRKWPILFCFDPAKRAMVPIELFRDAAERHGFIIVSSGSYDSADSVGRSIAVMTSLWNDAISRFPVNFDRVYAAGFSGGGRICWILDQMAQDVDLAGIIEVGAGLPRRDYLDGWQPRLSFYGLIGLTDYNYYEMVDLDRELGVRSIPHRLVTFDGDHEWPPAEACAEALDWMQIEAMRSGKVSEDRAFVDQVFAREQLRTEEAEKAGRLLEAHERASDVAATFRGLRDVAAMEQIGGRLAASKEFARLRSVHDDIDRSAADWVAQAQSALEKVPLARTVFERPTLAQLVTAIELPALRMLRNSADPEERLAGMRVMEAIYVRAGSTMPRDLCRRGDYEGAAVLLRLAAEIQPEHPSAWYDLACAYARSDRPRDALRALDRAVAAGFNDPNRMRNDPDLESLRQDSVFVRLLQRIGAN